MFRFLIPVLVLLPVAVQAEAIVAARMIRAQTLLTVADIALRSEAIAGALQKPSQALGREARVNIYAGRPILPGDLTAPAVIERNQIIVLTYFGGGLSISTEGRAMDRAGPGALVRVMNLDSRSTVTGTVMADGSVSVGPVSR
ncbi:flagellar basal body P-ring formation chaperone FlgA [Pseudoruegeria sp. SK021]|uniref:flagellar basal body P-ring formation chaperone FlgA n=1 Tax=Pseudoruegeria sp. SK021 TaxID=1933035 RepID=UPI000A236B88|nr:flagellar basal body P-ring formation chaperone FlgA [Pseudoruegeria sp. SK021]OSP54750.1 flagella basal body P-ring formation protein FlgA [Pseudoruegeria sp. SK021]